jgi:hypothetical protein
MVSYVNSVNYVETGLRPVSTQKFKYYKFDNLKNLTIQAPK